MEKRLRPILAILTTALWTSVAHGQSPASASPVATSPSAFRLGPEDVIQIRAVDADDIADKPIKIAADGSITVPVVGRIQAAGLTVDELQAVVVQRLKKLIISPDVSVSLTETHSHPFTVLGAVKTPGVFQLTGRKTLLDALSQCGGPADDAGYSLRISRRKESGPLPLPGAAPDPTGEFMIAEVSLQNIMDSSNPSGNILLMPDDVISVPRGQMVYVIGEVTRPGSIVVGGQKSVTVMQAIAIVSGFTKFAKSKEARILRFNPDSPIRTAITVDVKDMLAGKLADVALVPNDILYVPNSLVKEIGMSSLQSATGMGLSTMIYRIP